VVVFVAANPEQPAMSVEEFRGTIATLLSQGRYQVLVSEDGGRVIGFGVLIEMYWTGEEGDFNIAIAVEEAERGRGVGSALYERLIPLAGEWGARALHTSVREDWPASRRFAERRGFVDTGHGERMSRLDVWAADLAGYEGLTERLAAEEIRIVPLSDFAGDEGLLRAVHALHIRTAEDEPGSTPFAMPFEPWRDSYLVQPGVSPEWIFVAMDGATPIGLTGLQRRGEDSAHLFGMGVERSHRGRGIARLLKLRQIEWARENGVRYLLTGNDVENERMYEINMRLGFQPLPAQIDMIKTL
jgi:GNAT superfamily N-acetyltransferase